MRHRDSCLAGWWKPAATICPRRPAVMKMRPRRSRHFLEHLVQKLAEATDSIFAAEEIVRGASPLHRLDPRAKVVATVALIVASTTALRMWVIAALLLAAIALAVLGKIGLRRLATGVWLGALTFSGVIALPALFLTPGDAWFHLP